MSKKTIVYFNSNSYVDTDVTVLGQIARDYNLIWIPLIPKVNPKFKKKQLEDYASKNGIELHLFEYNSRVRSVGYTLVIVKIVLLIMKINPDLIFSSTRNLQWSLLLFFSFSKG